jgi:hypothetical protein
MSAVVITGQRELVARLRRLGGPRLRTIARRVTSTAMAPVLADAKASAPIGPTGRLRASVGKLASTNKRRDAFSSRVGIRRDFTYRSSSGAKTVSGRGKKRDAALAKGYAQDKKSAQQYARLIEFGYDRKGRLRRKAGGAFFLEGAISSRRAQILGTVATELRRYVDQTPTT